MSQDKAVPSTQSKLCDIPLMDKTLKREIYLAQKIQAQLLNGRKPVFEGMEVSGASISARLIGGDYYDFYPLANGKIRIVIGDVMGKGIPAAMLMILTRGAFRSAAETTSSPAETLMSINQALYSDLRTLKSFVTLLCADWDPIGSTLTYASAGHPFPLLIKAKENSIEEVPKIKGIMVGGLPHQAYSNYSIPLCEQDVVFFYTDGIVEAQNQNKEQFKLSRLIDTLMKNKTECAKEIEQNVLNAINQFTEGAVQRDDITMIVLKVKNQRTEITRLNSPLVM